MKAQRPKFSEKRQNVVLVQDRISNTSKRVLRGALNARRITPWSVNVQPIPVGSYVINFGGGALPPSIERAAQGAYRVLNPPDKVAIASNKINTFMALLKAKVPTVKWTTDKGDIAEWLGKDHKVLARLSVTSSGGRGIRVLEAGGDIPDAPLYTRYFPKTHEFRVHVVNGQAIDLVEKKLREENREKREKLSVIRNHDNGWVFAHDNLSLTHADDITRLRGLAVDSAQAVGLDFGAVDILAILDEAAPRRLKKCVVCELNSAPGIENTVTTAAYVKAFNELIASGK